MKTRLLTLLLIFLPTAAFASPGNTDANGGHYEHATGLYHYHHGYAAHQHENGICPYTGQIWELKIPERPATLEEWKALSHTSKDDVAVIDDETDAVAMEKGKESSSIPYVAAGGAAAAAGAATLVIRRRKQKKGEKDDTDYQEPSDQTECIAVDEPVASDAPEPEFMPEEKEAVEAGYVGEEVVGSLIDDSAGKTPAKPDNIVSEDKEKGMEMPDDTVIGEDGLPWEKEAYERYLAKKKVDPYDTSVPTNFAEPKWGRRYTFCTDADGDEIHTMDCELAFIQINVADLNCPNEDCKICHPIRPDLQWYAQWKKKQEGQV